MSEAKVEGAYERRQETANKNNKTRDSNSSTDEKELADKLGDSHMNLLPTKKLIICLAAMSLGLFMTFTDQQSVTIALPTIAKDLNSENTINWAGTAALLANTVCQVLFGRLADIFGRKTVLLWSMGILSVADLCCGFAQTGVQFYVFRAFAGVGQGGIQSMTMTIVSDIVTLKQRGKYQGILGANVGLGNSIGPFIMAAFIEHSSWRNFYHMMTPLIIVVMIPIYFIVDNKLKKEDILSKKEKFMKIDYLGFFFSTASLTLILIPLSGGGSTYAWNSPLVIGMFIVGGICFIGFIIIEWKIPSLPMIPIRLFSRASLSIILLTNFLFGICYYGLLYYLPYYFQIVKNLDTIHSCILLLPLVMSQSVSSIIGGNLISFSGHYIYIVIIGYGLWLLAACLMLLFGVTTNYGSIVGILLVQGIGIGWTFQPTMVAAQAQARKSERAVVIGCRNVVRSFGGAVGIAISSTIFGNTLLREINQELKSSKPLLNTSYLNYLKLHIYNKISVDDLTAAQLKIVHEMYMKSIKNTYYLYIPLMAVCFISSTFVKDRGLQCIDEINPEGEKIMLKDKLFDKLRKRL